MFGKTVIRLEYFKKTISTLNCLEFSRTLNTNWFYTYDSSSHE